MVILRKWLPVVAILVMSLLMTQKAFAYFQSVNDLIPIMHEYVRAEAKQDYADYANASIFRANIQGVYDATEADYDTPKDFSLRQLLAIVVKYIKENPKEWNQPAGLVVRKALLEAFPKR